MPTRLVSCCLVAALALVPIACGRSKPEGLASVCGKVNYKGRPLTSGTIVFVPDAEHGTNGALARADIQPDGSYRLKCGELVGTVPGWHRVTVTCVEDGGLAPGQILVVPRSVLPAKYQDPQLSGLSCEVKGGQENAINFNLE
jgi:hypothetical protein